MLTKRRISSFFIVIMAFAFILSGCSGAASPKSPIRGYYAYSQSVSGGSNLFYINLNDIKVEKKQEDTVVTLEFMDGSSTMNMPVEPTQGVPKYSTQWINGLNRLQLNINGLIYWDYKVYPDEIKDTPILGIFKQTPVISADTTSNDMMITKLYFNLDGKIAYKIVTKGNLLMLYLRALPQELHSNYYVLLDAFDDFTNNLIPSDEGLLPTLCSDKTNVMLISQPFATRAEANTFLDKKNESLLPNLQGKTAFVEQLKDNELPAYDAKGALESYANTPVMKSNGTESTAPVLINNGRLLCWSPTGDAYVYANPFFLGGTGGSEPTTYEKIYLCENGATTPTLISDFEYSHIISAQFSDDGRYLAFLDQGLKDRSLYIYDTKKTGQPISAAESGFGEDTASFTWGSGTTYGHTIFAITGEASGEEEMLQLMDYTLQDNQPTKVETLAENSFTEGVIDFYNGKVYYAQSSDQKDLSGLFCFDPVTRVTSRLSDGIDFKMNRSSGTMAVLYDVSTASSPLYDLKTYNISLRQWKTVLQKKPIIDDIWSGNGSTIFYTLDNGSDDPKDPYQLSLNQYSLSSGDSNKVADIPNGSILPSDNDTEVLLTIIYPEATQFVPMTYRVSAMPAAQ